MDKSLIVKSIKFELKVVPEVIIFLKFAFLNNKRFFYWISLVSSGINEIKIILSYFRETPWPDSVNSWSSKIYLGLVGFRTAEIFSTVSLRNPHFSIEIEFLSVSSTLKMMYLQ